MKRKDRLSFNHELTFATSQRHRGRWIVAALVIVLVAGAGGYAMRNEIRPHLIDPEPVPIAQAPSETLEPAAAPEPEPPPVVKVNIEYVVRPKDSLGEIFTRLKIDVNHIPVILNLPLVRDRFKPLQPGDKLVFALEDGALHGMDRRISETEILSITRGERGFRAAVVPTPIELKTAQVRGTIGTAQFAAGRVVGVSAELVQQLTNEIFPWDIDFAHDIRAGDHFKVVYQQKFRGDEYLGDGGIVAAEFVNGDETYRAVRYTSPDGKIDGYFAPDGHSMRRRFLRAPLDIARVDPNYGLQGRQPALAVMSDHRGIDYPAPKGTEVKAAGDGRIKSVGANGDYGNVIIIEHDRTISTLYAHLSAFAGGLRVGRSVKQGDVVGYVGDSGAATAPHLHYEFRVNGTPTDPRTVDAPAVASIPAKYLSDFQKKSAALLSHLDESSDAVVTAALAE